MSFVNIPAPKVRSVAELAEEVHAASSALVDARSRADAARRDETACLNRLNLAQKKMDEAVEALRSSADRDSDWKNRKNPGIRHPVEE